MPKDLACQVLKGLLIVAYLDYSVGVREARLIAYGKSCFIEANYIWR